MGVKLIVGIVAILATCAVARTATLEFGCLQGQHELLSESSSTDNPGCFVTRTDTVAAECVPCVDLPLPGDANEDGKVDFQDLVVLGSEYQLHGPGLPGDFNHDGCVNFADLVVLARNYGSCSGTIRPDSSPAEAPLPPVAPAGALLLVVLGAARWMRDAKGAAVRARSPSFPEV